MAQTMTVAEQQRRALRRALGLGLAGEVIRVGYGHYRLPSTTRPGVFHTVRVVDGTYTCDCEAGRSGRPCCHAAGVFIRKLEEAARGRAVVVGVPRGTPAPVPAGELPENVVALRRAA